MPTSPSSPARSAAAPAAAANKQQNSPTATRISLLAIPLIAVALSRRRGPRVFTKAELAKYVDTSRGLKVAICGQVFDVTKGAEFYAKGAGYGFFAGRDASLAFATGNFKTNLTDNVGAPASFFERRVDGVPWRLDVRESIASTASRWNRSATMEWRAREIDGVERQTRTIAGLVARRRAAPRAPELGQRHVP